MSGGHYLQRKGVVEMMEVGILLIVLGAILAFAVDISTPGLDLSALGMILLLLGLACVVADLVMSGAFRRRTTTVVETPPEVVARESGGVEDSYVDERINDSGIPPRTASPDVSQRRVVRRRRFF